MIVKGNRTTTPDDILCYIDEAKILEFYLGITNLPTVICSPLREDDTRPSFGLYYNESGKLVYYDYSTRDAGGVFDLLMKMYKLSFQDVLNKVYEEVILKIPPGELVKIDYKGVKREFKSVPTKIQVKTREWRNYDLDFWAKYGISKPFLEFGDIYPITHVFIEKQGVSFTVPAEKYAYVYVEFKDNTPTYKIYQPYSKDYKWMNNHNKSVWDLWSKLPESGDKVIITSSRKDALCLWENLNIPSTSGQAESVVFKSHVVDLLNSRFVNKYVLYDNDFNSENNWGRINGEKLASMYGFKQIEIPSEYESKDPSDLYKNHGKDVFLKVLNNLLI